MAREIKTKLTIDGEQQYKRAIKDANTALHTLGTELSLASAQFIADGDAMKLMESRSKTLKAELEQQSKVIENTEKALQQATRQYGENSKQAQDWQAKLNTARAKLMNLEHELDNNSQGLDKNGKAFDTASGKAAGFGSELQQVDKISKGVTFQALDTALNNIGGIFERVGQTAARAWKAVWNTAGESSNWADDLATMSQQTGVSIGELQKWLYSADYIDTDVGTITKAMKRFVNASGDVSAALKQLGIHGKEAWLVVQDNGAVDSYETTYNAMELFWQTIDKLHAMNEEMELADLAGDITKATELERTMEQLSQALYGKSFAEMQPLIKAGREAWEEYGKQAEETGAVLSDDLVNNLTLFNDSLQTLQNDFDAFKNTFSADLAPGLTKVSDAVSKVLEQFTLWAQSEQGQKAIGDLGEAIGGLVSSFTDNIDFEAVVTGVTGAINGLTGALNWFSENGDAVKAIILGIGTAIAGIKVTKGLLSFAAVMRIAGGGLFKGGGGSPSAGVPVPSAPGAAAGGGAAGGGIFANMWNAGKNLLKTALPIFGQAAAEGAVIAALSSPVLIADEVERRKTKAFLDGTREMALKEANDLGETGQAAKDAIFTLTDALGESTDKFNLFGQGVMGDAEAIDQALDDVTGNGALSGETNAILKYRQANGGHLPMGIQKQLGYMALDDAADALSSPAAARNAMNTAEALEMVSGALADFGSDRRNLEYRQGLDSTLREIAADPAIFPALAAASQAALGEYLTETNPALGGLGYADPTVEASRVLEMLETDLQRQMLGSVMQRETGVGSGLAGAFGSTTSLLSLLAGRPASLDEISDFLDEIINVNDALDNGDTLDGMDAMYKLFDSLKNSNLRNSLPKDTNDLLDKYFDLDSGYGAGGPNWFSDAHGLLGIIFQDLSNAWDEGMSDTSGAEEAGKGLADAAALGISGGVGAVGSAASAMVAAVVSAITSAAIPAVPRFGGGAGNTNYNNSNSMYIGNYNNYSGADVGDLMAQFNRVNRYERMGRGAG